MLERSGRRLGVGLPGGHPPVDHDAVPRCRRRACGPARRSPARTGRPGRAGGTAGNWLLEDRCNVLGERRLEGRPWPAWGSGSRPPRRGRPRRRPRDRPGWRAMASFNSLVVGVRLPLAPGGEGVVDPPPVADGLPESSRTKGLGRDLGAEPGGERAVAILGDRGISGRIPGRAWRRRRAERSGSTQTPTIAKPGDARESESEARIGLYSFEIGHSVE